MHDMIVILGAVLCTLLAWLHIPIFAFHAAVQNTTGMFNDVLIYCIGVATSC